LPFSKADGILRTDPPASRRAAVGRTQRRRMNRGAPIPAMTRFDDVDRLKREIELMEAQVHQLARAALRVRNGPEGAYARAMARYETERGRLLEKKNTFRQMLGEDPLPL
jgi:hypothetical protein